MTWARRFDQLSLIALITAAFVVFGRAWLFDHPHYDPWAPLEIDDPPGWATARKLAGARADPRVCRAVLARSDIAFVALPPIGADACRRPDRLSLAAVPLGGARLKPEGAEATCAVELGLVRWAEQTVQPAAKSQFGVAVDWIEHFGTFQCRHIANSRTGRWSEHATGNAIDVSAFVLADGRRIVVRSDWPQPDTPQGRFLRRVRDGACTEFGTVLSPDYNAAHFDHFHLDQEVRPMGWQVCD